MIARETPAFDAFLDYWRLPVGGSPIVASVVERDETDSSLSSTLVYLRGGDEPRLYHVDGAGYLFARVKPIERPPESLKIVARVMAQGQGYSYILEDPARKVIYLPFSPSEAVNAFLHEKYVPSSASNRRRLSTAVYYAVKRFAPRPALVALRSHVARRKKLREGFPHWPLETSLDDLQRTLLQLLLRVTRSDDLPFVWFWPHGKQAAFALTHDVESADGRDAIPRFLQLEAAYGLVSSYNLIPHKYELPPEVREHIERSSCEVGVHGWDHEGSLVLNRQHFLAQAERIDEIAAKWCASGFRSPSTHRNPDWFPELGFEYDSSFPDTDPYEPQPGGCLSLSPFMLSDMVELPITMPQDHTMFRLLQHPDESVWLEKARALIARNGLVCVLTHPDIEAGYAGNEAVFPLYERLLQSLADDRSLWHALPRDVAQWWRSRMQSTVSPDGTRIEGPCRDQGVCARARLRDGQLVFALPEGEGHNVWPTVDAPTSDAPRQPTGCLRVAMIAHSYYPGDVRIRREATALVDAGHEVDVFCLTSDADTTSSECVGGVQVHRLSTRRARQHRRLPYLFEYATSILGLAVSLSARMAARQYQVVQVHTLPDVLVFATALTKARGARIVLDMHDLMPELYMSKYGSGEQSRGVRLLRWTERISTRFAHHVVTASEAFADRLVAVGVPSDKVTVVLNTADPDVFPFIHPGSRSTATDRFVVFWHGTMVRRYGLDLAVEAIAALRDVIPGLKLIIYGLGECADEIAELVHALRLEDVVELRGYISHTELPRHIAEADVGVVPNRPDPHIEMAYPTKLLEFVQMGVPVVSTRTMVLERMFGDGSLVFVEDTAAGIAEGIAWVHSHRQEAERRAVQAQAKCESVAWQHMKGIYVDVVEGLGRQSTVERLATQSRLP